MYVCMYVYIYIYIYIYRDISIYIYIYIYISRAHRCERDPQVSDAACSTAGPPVSEFGVFDQPSQPSPRRRAPHQKGSEKEIRPKSHLKVILKSRKSEHIFGPSLVTYEFRSGVLSYGGLLVGVAKRL